MSHIPLSAAIISDGVVTGVLSMRLVQLSIIFWACLISAFVATQVSAPYVSIGIKHVWTSFHIVDISMLWNSSFPARLKMVWIAASVFPFIRSHDNHVIIDMNMRTLRYKRIHIEHDDADTKRTLSPECSSEMLTEMLTETEADKTLSDTELLDIMRPSYDVIREHGRDDDYVSVFNILRDKNSYINISAFISGENCEMTVTPFNPPQKPKFPQVKLPPKFFCLLTPYRCHLNNTLAFGTQFPPHDTVKDYVSKKHNTSIIVRYRLILSNRASVKCALQCCNHEILGNGI